MSSAPRSPLTRIIKRILDVVRVLAFAGLILWPLFVLVATLGQYSSPETWGVDINVFTRIVIDLNAFAGDLVDSAGVRDPVISGKAALNIDTSSLHALYLFTAITEIGGIFGLYIVVQLRTLFATLESGASFSPENSGRIKKIGLGVISWALATPILQYFGGREILAEYSLHVPGVELHPAFNLNATGVFVGLALIVLSSLMSEAASINEAQELTI